MGESRTVSAAKERRQSMVEILSLLTTEVNLLRSGKPISGPHIDIVCDALDHYIARSSQGWVR